MRAGALAEFWGLPSEPSKCRDVGQESTGNRSSSQKDRRTEEMNSEGKLTPSIFLKSPIWSGMVGREVLTGALSTLGSLNEQG